MVSSEETAVEQKKESWKFPWLLTIIIFSIAVIMFALVFGPGFFKKQQMQDDMYGNFTFVQGEDKFWYTLVNRGEQPVQISFYYHPRELEDVAVESRIRDKFFAMRQNKGHIYITIDPEAGDNSVVIAGVEISKITGQAYQLLNVPTNSAFTRAPESILANTQTPILTCENATAKRMIIQFNITSSNHVTSDGNCITINTKGYNESIIVADRLMYHLLGIMK